MRLATVRTCLDRGTWPRSLRLTTVVSVTATSCAVWGDNRTLSITVTQALLRGHT